MTKTNHSEIVSKIVDDIASHAPLNPYVELIPDALDVAYDIQDQVAEMLVARSVRTAPCGYKLAVNSQPAMKRFGISEPCAGWMFSDQKWQSPAQLSSGDYRSLLVEAEIMAVMAADMPPRTGGHTGGHTRADAEAAIEIYLPAIEMVDPRGLDMSKARLASVVAQNVTTEGLVFGGPGLAPQLLDVEALEVSLSFDGKVQAQTKGGAPQHPGDAVAWLATFLNTRGKMLKRGDIIICGTHVPPTPIGTAGHALVDMGPLGKVEFTIS